MISPHRRRRIESTSAVRRASTARPSPVVENSCWIAADSRAYKSRNSLLTVATVLIPISPESSKPACDRGGRTLLLTPIVSCRSLVRAGNLLRGSPRLSERLTTNDRQRLLQHALAALVVPDAN